VSRVRLAAAPLIISAGQSGLRSWRLDGHPGELQILAHGTGIHVVAALAVVEYQGAPLIISAGDDGALRSWRLDGRPGELQVPDAHAAPILALAVVEDLVGPLIISAGIDEALRSWRVDGAPGPLQVNDTGTISALAVIEYEGPLIISAGLDGALRRDRTGRARRSSSLAALERSTARAVEVRKLSLGSLEIVVQLPADVLTTAGAAATGVAVMKLSKMLDAIKRVAGFRAEVRLSRTQLEAAQLRAEADVLEAQDRVSETRAHHRIHQLTAAGWEIEQAVLTDDEDDVL
jgi:hypothetical protein